MSAGSILEHRSEAALGEQRRDEEENVTFAPKRKGAENEGGDASSSSDSDSDSDDDKAKFKRARNTEEDRVSDDELAALRKEAEDDGAATLGKRRRLTKEQLEGKAQASSRLLAQPDTLTAAQKIWEEMKDGADQHHSRSSIEYQGGSHEAGTVFIRVLQKYRFAGEDHVNEKLLPESHPDAQSFLQAQAKLGKPVPRLNADGSSMDSERPRGGDRADDPATPAIVSVAALSSGAAGAATASPKPRPGPRKKKSSLASLSAAVTAPRAPKLNTLEKSKLDWEGWKSSAAPASQAGLTDAEREEMEAQTKGGSSGLGSMKGYMERKQFLERVEGRLDEASEPASKR